MIGDERIAERVTGNEADHRRERREKEQDGGRGAAPQGFAPPPEQERQRVKPPGVRGLPVYKPQPCEQREQVKKGRLHIFCRSPSGALSIGFAVT
jgi:hypothetical protein